MWSIRGGTALTLATLAVVTSACGKSDGMGPDGNDGIVCQIDDPLCPPENLPLGLSGPAGSPTIEPSSFTGTSLSVTASVFPVEGTTNSITNGYWLLVVGNELRASGTLTVTSGVFDVDIPLFCGAQSILLTFTNSTGRSYYDATVTRLDCTTPEFRVQLTWDSGPDSDIDLHLLRPGGSFGSNDDCYWLNCQGIPLEWGAGGPEGDPILDLDDVLGYGPENIFIVSGAEAGEYRVVIHNFDDSPSTRATVRLYFDDVEAAHYTSDALDAPSKTYWEPAKVRITTKQITPVGTYSPGPPASVGAAAAPRVK